jgi:hypothetical protein
VWLLWTLVMEPRSGTEALGFVMYNATNSCLYYRTNILSCQICGFALRFDDIAANHGVLRRRSAKD